MSPTISPAPRVSETSANSPARVACRTSSAGRRLGGRPRGQLVLDAFAGHQLGEPVVVEIGGAEGADLAAVAQHRDPLGDLDHLFQPVADEDDGDALRLQPADGREQELDLVAGQRGGRLVHEQDAGVGGEAAADRDDLALRHGQRPDAGVERKVGVEPGERRLRRRAHRPPGRRPQRRARARGRWRCSPRPSGWGRARGPGRSPGCRARAPAAGSGRRARRRRRRSRRPGRAHGRRSGS